MCALPEESMKLRPWGFSGMLVSKMAGTTTAIHGFPVKNAKNKMAAEKLFLPLSRLFLTRFQLFWGANLCCQGQRFLWIKKRHMSDVQKMSKCPKCLISYANVHVWYHLTPIYIFTRFLHYRWPKVSDFDILKREHFTNSIYWPFINRNYDVGAVWIVEKRRHVNGSWPQTNTRHHIIIYELILRMTTLKICAAQRAIQHWVGTSLVRISYNVCMIMCAGGGGC